MSGRKTITIDTNDLNALRAQARRATTLDQANTVRANQQATAQVTALRNRLQQELENSNNRIIALNDQHAADMQQMRVDVATAISQNNRQIEDALAQYGVEGRQTETFYHAHRSTR